MTSWQPGEPGTPLPPAAVPDGAFVDPTWAPPVAPTSAPAAFPEAAAPGASARRRRLKAAFVAVPAVLLVAGAASVVTLVVAGRDSDQAATASAAAAPATSQQTAKRQAILGTITAATPTSWTLHTAQGTVTVDLSGKTHYGTSKAPATVSSFHQGSTVRVLGRTTGETIDATHVVVAHAGKAASATGGTTSTTAQTAAA